MRPPRRSVLFTPGDQERRLRKALTLPADTVTFDLEDAVAPDAKALARETAAKVLRDVAPAPGGPERCVRINGLEGDAWRADLEAAVPARPDAIMVPKADNPARVARLAQELGELEARHGLPHESVRLLLIIETARGVLDAWEVGQIVHRRLGALIFGAEDLAADAGLTRTPESLEVLYARSRVALCAAALRVDAIDQVYTRIEDAPGLEREARFARGLGYCGKMVIHPDQIPPVHAAFAASPDEVERARRLLLAAEDAKGGAFRFEGRMIDEPLLRQARRLVEGASR